MNGPMMFFFFANDRVSMEGICLNLMFLKHFVKSIIDPVLRLL
jgi:hypothetical protein